MSDQAYRRSRAAAQRRRALRRRGSSSSRADDRLGERARIVRRNGNGGLRRHHVTVPGDVGRDHGRRAGEGARQHHAEALATERRGDERLGRGELGRQIVLAQEAEHVDAVVGNPQPGQQQPYGERVGAGDAEPRTRALVDLRPGAEQHVKALPRLVAAGEDHAVLAATRLDAVGDQHAVRNHLVLARQPALRRRPGALGHGDPVVEALGEEAPDRRREPHPAEIAGRVEGSDVRAVASARARPRTSGVIGSCRWSTSKRSRSRTRRMRKMDRGRGTMFGSEPFAGTITDRPIGITSAGGFPWRPTRGCSARVNWPGGSLPMTRRTSCPRSRRAAAWSSACSTTAPQKDHENGTTMPIFTEWPVSQRGLCRTGRGHRGVRYR